MGGFQSGTPFAPIPSHRSQMKKKILIVVDDNEVLIKIVQMSFRDSYETLLANGGNQCHTKQKSAGTTHLAFSS